MKKTLLLLGALTLAGCNNPLADRLTCSSPEATQATQTLRDLIQTKVIQPLIDIRRGGLNSQIAMDSGPDQNYLARRRQNCLDQTRQARSAKPYDPYDQFDYVAMTNECVKREEAAHPVPLDPNIEKMKADAAAQLAALDKTPLLFDVKEVITTGKTEFKASCKAKLNLSDSSLTDFPFTFTVEKTDDGKSICVTEEGL
jgi:hypothetical protein